MKRHIIIAVLLMALSFSSGAQQVVIDPSQIAASATNAANQIDYMLDQLGELAHLGDQMNTMREHIDNVFGEDGIGGKAISVMQDLGTLARLTESYNSTIKMTEAYARQMKEMERYKLSDANIMLSYLNSIKTQIELAIETAKKILSTMGYSKAEKKEEIEKIIEEMDTNLAKMEKIMQIETQSTVMAEGMNEFMDFIDEEMSAEDFIQAKKAYGCNAAMVITNSTFTEKAEEFAGKAKVSLKAGVEMAVQRTTIEKAPLKPAAAQNTQVCPLCRSSIDKKAKI